MGLERLKGYSDLKLKIISKMGDEESKEEAKRLLLEREKNKNDQITGLFKIGDVVKVVLSKRRKERGGETIEGTIVKLENTKGYNQYVIDTEIGSLVRRESVLEKIN